MIVDYKCDNCRLSSICQGKAKLKPFSEDAKTDLGVMIRMVDCNNYSPEEEIEPREGILLDEEEE